MTTGFHGLLPTVLPQPITPQGTVRRLGVEIEFAGLSEEDAALVFAKATDGRTKQASKGWTCETALFGACEIYLDTSWRDTLASVGGKNALDLARTVVPVELVTEPFDPKHLPEFDSALAELRDAGATGSRESLFHGFGVHLNVEAASLEAAHVATVTRAFALLEPLLRSEIELDVSRRALPFVDPYPKALVDALTADLGGGLEVFADLYLRHIQSRNHGLDLLPILAEALPDTVGEAVGKGEKIAPRPAWHYRLPESRIDEPEWGISGDWKLWCLVESVAAEPNCLAELCRAWARYRAGADDRDWVDISRDIVASRLGTVAA